VIELNNKNMQKYSNKKVVFIIGTLGSGKGTQAEKLEETLGLRHFDTGPFLKELFASNDPSIEKEKTEYESGKLVSPEFVTKKVLEKSEELLAGNNLKGLIFSGSPRTLFEAERELPFFEEMVEKENIKVFYINLSEQVSMSRSFGRLICEKNSHSIPNLPEFQKIRDAGVCPEDGSKLIKKDLDTPEILKERLKEFNNRTIPVLDFMKERDYKVIEINGEQSIEKVTEDILKNFNDSN